MNKQCVADTACKSERRETPVNEHASAAPWALPERRGDIVKYARQIETLYVVARRVGASMNMHDMLNSSLAEIVREMEADAGAIYILDAPGRALQLKARTGRSKNVFSQVSTIRLCGDELARLLQWKEPGLDVLKMANFQLKLSRSDTETPDGFALAPLVARGKVHGILLLGGNNRRFTSQEIELLGSACAQIAIGIENIQLFETTKQLAITDELTGLFNRRHFYEVLQAEIFRSERYNHQFSIALLDLDRFKTYNDIFGHGGGDRLLVAFGQTLKQGLRKTDAGFRYGGDEFALILPLTQASQAKRVISRIRGKWDRSEDPSLSSRAVSVGFSAGLAQFPENATTPDGLVLIADAALYQSKRLGIYKCMTASDLPLSPPGRNGEDCRDSANPQSLDIAQRTR
ncbi:MAG: sensor domain-containing diguanylate cyclase [Dehalococcoidia bacterium]|nr:sensor domain-containing diguanylate cyclase [Dehalococcoidia bacterium]